MNKHSIKKEKDTFPWIDFYDRIYQSYKTIDDYYKEILTAFISLLNFNYAISYEIDNRKQKSSYEFPDNILVANKKSLILNKYESYRKNTITRKTGKISTYNLKKEINFIVYIISLTNRDIILLRKDLLSDSHFNDLEKVFIHIEKNAAGIKAVSDIDKLQKEIKYEKSFSQTLLDILDQVPGKVFLKDHDGKMLLVNKMVAYTHDCKKEELLGKSDLDFFADNPELANSLWNEEQEIIKSSEPRRFEQKEYVNNADIYLKTHKIPFHIHYLNKTGLLGIQFDITDVKEIQLEVAKRNEELTEVQQKLEFEKALLDNLLAYFPDLIYFKDKDSRFIRMSNSFVKLFKGAKGPQDIIGKSDFDFHDKEGAQKRYGDEQRIMKTKQPLLNDLEHVFFEGDIGEQWWSTTKLPLLNSKGKSIGTFGITQNITESKKMEIELKEKNEELAANEEELRQNLEELHTTQEHLNHQLEENEKINDRLTFETALLTNSYKVAIIVLKIN